MKLNPGFRLRKIAGDYILINEGAKNVNLNSTFSLSESAAWLWGKCEDREFSRDDMVCWLLEEYDVDETTARTDVDETIAAWEKYGFFVRI